MRLLSRIAGGLAALRRRSRVDAELDAELREFLQASIDAKIADGMSPEDAARAARIELGSPAAVKDWVGDVGWETRVESVWQDVRYAVRMLRGSPGFACAAIGTLAVGLGATAAMFAIVDGVLLKPLPYREADRLVEVRLRDPQGGSYGLAGGTLLAVRQLPAVEAAAASILTQHTMVGGDVPRLVTGEAVTEEFFNVFPVQASVGRVFSAGDRTGGPVVILADALWRKAFASRHDVVDKTIDLNGVAHRVLGVLPASFLSPDGGSAGYWVLRPFSGAEAAQQGTGPFQVFSRLRTSDLPSARAQVATLAMKPAEAGGEPLTLSLSPLLDTLSEFYGQTLWSLLGAVSLVLLLSCGNVAHLLLTRARARTPELGLRAALGARTGRLLRQILTECGVLATLAAGAASLIAALMISALPMLPMFGISRLEEVTIDARVHIFTLTLAFGTVLLFGLGPAMAACRPRAMSERTTTAGGARRASQLLIAAEIAATVALLIGTGLVALRISDLLNTDVGFDIEQLQMASLRPTRLAYTGTASTTLYTRVLERLRERSGLEAVLIDRLPLDRWRAQPVRLVQSGQEGVPPVGAGMRILSPGALQHIGARILRGREFTSDDGAGAPAVAVVNRALAERLWGAVDPVGASITVVRGSDPHVVRIVGVVDDLRDSLYRPAWPEVYTAIAQIPTPQMTIVVRTPRRPDEVTAALRDALRDVDAQEAVSEVTAVRDLVKTHTARNRFIVILLGIFTALAVLLAATGVLAVATAVVASRTKEIGIRVAIGASRAHVLGRLARDFVPSLAIGAFAGLAAAYSSAQLLRSLAPGVASFHPVAYGAAALAVVLIAAVGVWWPARRALAIEPTLALSSQQEW